MLTDILPVQPAYERQTPAAVAAKHGLDINRPETRAKKRYDRIAEQARKVIETLGVRTVYYDVALAKLVTHITAGIGTMPINKTNEAVIYDVAWIIVGRFRDPIRYRGRLVASADPDFLAAFPNDDAFTAYMPGNRQSQQDIVSNYIRALANLS